MAFKPPGPGLDFSKLKSILANARIQDSNNALYQTIFSLIEQIDQFKKETDGRIAGLAVVIEGESSGGGSGEGDLPLVQNQTFLTATNQVSTLINSRELLAGDNVTFDDTVANQRTINVEDPPIASDYVTMSDGGLPTPLVLDDGFGNFIYILYNVGGGSMASGITELIGDGTAGPGTGTQTLTLANTGVAAGSYGSNTLVPVVTVDAKGRITNISTISVTTSAGIDQLTGDVVAGPGTGSQAATLSASGATPGTYGSSSLVPVVTVDAKGRITSITTVAVSGGGGSGITQLTGPVTAGPGTGSVATSITANSITDAMLRQSAALTVMGRSVNAAGNVADIPATTNDRILSRVSNALGFNQVTAGMIPSALLTPTMAATDLKTQSILFPITGASGGIITTGFKGVIRIPVGMTVIRWSVMNNAAGNITFGIFSNAPLTTYPPTTSITAAAPPQTTAAAFNSSSTLTGWTTSIPALNVLGISVTAVDGVLTQSTLQIDLTLA